MLKLLLNAGENKFNTSLQEFSEKIFYNLHENKNLDLFLQEISNFILNFQNINQKNNENKDKELCEHLFYFCEILRKIEKIRNFYCYYECNQFYSENSYDEILNFIYFNIWNILIKSEVDEILLISSWKYLILNDEIQINFFDNFSILESLFDFLNKNSSIEYKYMQKLFEKFNFQVSQIINDLLNKFLDQDKNLVKIFINFLKIYEKIRFMYNIFFKDNYFSYVNKNKIFFSNIFKSLNSCENLKVMNPEKSIEEIFHLLKKKEYHIILKIIQILRFDEEYFEKFIFYLLQAFKIFYKEIYSNYEKQKFSLIFISYIKEFEDFLFNEKNLKFFSLDDYYQNFKKIISEVLNTKGCKSKIFSEFFDEVLKNLSETKNLLEILFSYLDILEDYEKFEEFYTFQIINRSILEKLDKEKETEIINKIIQRGKDKFTHSFKLQTVINNIKIIKNSQINLCGIPSHCYHIFNLGCKPVIKNKNLLEIFENAKIKGKFPTNSRLITQQGDVEFNFKKNKKFTIRTNILQFEILSFIGNKIKSDEEIINYLEINADLFEYLSENLIKINLLISKEGKFQINFQFDCQMEVVNLYIPMLDYVKGKKSVGKLNQRDVKHILDCYIIKYLKKVKKSDFESLKCEVCSYMENSIVKGVENFNNFNNANSMNESILERLNILIEKTLVRKERDNLYVYA
jgi:hypothetical protein